jgi:hypothetical protein
MQGIYVHLNKEKEPVREGETYTSSRRGDSPWTRIRLQDADYEWVQVFYIPSSGECTGIVSNQARFDEEHFLTGIKT